MVYPILDNANVAYIGITNALAYQLPYEPINIEAALRRTPLAAMAGDADDGNGDGNSDGGSERISMNTAAAATPSTASAPMTSAADMTPTMPIDIFAAQRRRQPAVDRYYYTQPQTSYAAPSTVPRYPIRTNGGTYYFGAPDAPSNRPTSTIGREPGIVDRFSNKMDYYWSYANRLRKTVNALSQRRIDPWKAVKWSVKPTGGTYRFVVHRKIM